MKAPIRSTVGRSSQCIEARRFANDSGTCSGYGLVVSFQIERQTMRSEFPISPKFRRDVDDLWQSHYLLHVRHGDRFVFGGWGPKLLTSITVVAFGLSAMTTAGAVTTNPTPISCLGESVARVDAPPAEWPEMAVAQHASGTVVLAVQIDEAGALRDEKVTISSGNSHLDREALRVARYRPARVACKAIRCRRAACVSREGARSHRASVAAKLGIARAHIRIFPLRSAARARRGTRARRDAPLPASRRRRAFPSRALWR